MFPHEEVGADEAIVSYFGSVAEAEAHVSNAEITNILFITYIADNICDIKIS